MTEAEAIAKLESLTEIARKPVDRWHRNGDPESWHRAADDVLLSLVSPEVRAAYENLIESSDWWAFA